MRTKITDLASAVADKYESHDQERVYTVAISGIDAAGKGYISQLLQDELKTRGYRVALINIDPWQNPISIRLKKENAAENLYENIFRWNDFFEQLISPLQKNKSICLETKAIRTDTDSYYPLVYDYQYIDILLIEGIFLFKKKYLPRYDYRIWIECPFKTGMQRAIRRNTEKLEEEVLVKDYQTFYYPAQRYHFEKDDPKGSADFVFNND